MSMFEQAGPRKGPAAGPGGPRSAFRKAADAAEGLKPARVVEVPPRAWAPTWPDRAAEPVAVGLRVYSEAEAMACRAAAAGHAWRMHPQGEDLEERVAAGDGRLMALIVARCCVKAEDRTKPYFGVAADDQVPLALTPKGLEWLFGEVESLVEAESPVAREATDAELDRLAERIGGDDPFVGLGPADERRVRRLLGAALERLGF